MGKVTDVVAGAYTPAAIYYHDSDCVEYIKTDAFCIHERIDPFLTLVKDRTGHNLIGFKLKGFANLFKRLKPSVDLSDRRFLFLVSAIEMAFSDIGDSTFNDERRTAAYKAAYTLAANDNVALGEEELLAA